LELSTAAPAHCRHLRPSSSSSFAGDDDEEDDDEEEDAMIMTSNLLVRFADVFAVVVPVVGGDAGLIPRRSSSRWRVVVVNEKPRAEIMVLPRTMAGGMGFIVRNASLSIIEYDT